MSPVRFHCASKLFLLLREGGGGGLLMSVVEGYVGESFPFGLYALDT